MAEVWGAVIAGVGAVTSAYMANNAAGKAAGATTDASNAAIRENRRQFDLVRSDTAGQRALGNNSLDALSQLFFGRPALPASTGNPYAPGLDLSAATPYAPASGGGFGFKDALTFNPGAMVTSKLGTVGKILDPAASLFGNKHGDEKRNMSAFLAENSVYDLGNGMLALEDGTMFPKDQLQHVAGTWYGATYAPDGDQQGWQAKWQQVIAGYPNANASSGQTSSAPTGTTSGYRPTPGGGVQPILQATQGPSVPNAGAPSGPDMSVFFTSPDYQFRLAEGQKAIDRSAAARGGLLSGRTVKAGEQYASNLAAGEYGAFVDRLMQMAGIGSTGIAASANAGANTTGNITQAVTNAGNARASSYLTGAEGVNNAVQGGFSNYLLSRYLNQRPVSSGGAGIYSDNVGYGIPYAGVHA